MGKLDDSDAKEVVEQLKKYEANLNLLLDNPCANGYSSKGYEMGNIDNIGFYIMWVMSSYCRILKTPPALSLLELIIETNELHEQNTFPVGGENVEKEKNILQPAWLARSVQTQKRVELIWGGMYNEVFTHEAKDILSEQQIDYVLQILQTLNRRARVLKKRQEDTSHLIIWDEYKQLIPDPIYVPIGSFETHRKQRSERGYSDWDAKNPRAHIAWLIVQGVLYLASDKAMGFSAQAGSFPAWQIELLEFAEGIWADAFVNQGFTNDAAPLAIKKIPNILPNLWD
jgi:hypothetical protein